MNSYMHKFSFEGKEKCVETSGDEPMLDDLPILDEKQVKLPDIFGASGAIDPGSHEMEGFFR
ncbi:hypothetical protein PM082_021496 [Marasmius tenuissimus]|nr:hypothetical protein PM082_021496 [Marasmius tenuissimus]